MCGFACSLRYTVNEFYHKEGVTDPQTSPALRACWYGQILAMDSDWLRWNFTHWAAANVWRNLLIRHRHHGNGRRGGQPIGLVVPASIVADFIYCAVEEGDGAEMRQAGAGQSCKDEKNLSYSTFKAWLWGETNSSAYPCKTVFILNWLACQVVIYRYCD